MNQHSRIAAGTVSPEERALRRDLAACYRLVAMFGWDDLVATHISARLPGEESFLLNPFGVLFDEITASSLVKVDAEGNILDDTPWTVNRAGFVIHSAIHEARPEAACVMHLHTRDGVAVSAIEDGILPLNQTAMLISQDVGYHDYEGVALDLDERERLARDLGDRSMMMLRNHGTLAVGRSIPECFVTMYYLEWACAVQVRTLAMGRPLHDAGVAVVDKVARYRTGANAALSRDIYWPALLRRVERTQPGFDL